MVAPPFGDSNDSCRVWNFVSSKCKIRILWFATSTDAACCLTLPLSAVSFTRVRMATITARKLKIAVIGGSGLNNPEIIENRQEKAVDTPFGMPSDKLVIGKIKGIDCVLLCRHGRHHTIAPSNVNFRANIWALKEEGCTHIVATTACGSLQENIKPGDLVFLDQFIDRTTKRQSTFYDGAETSPKGICHIPMQKPFCAETRMILVESAKKLGLRHHSSGTNITVEGPRFSTQAESCLFQSWGAHIINMTTVPEVVLANEAGLCYASIALVTDYDCWRANEEGVCKDAVLNTLKENVSKVTQLLLDVIPKIASHDFTKIIERNQYVAQSSVMLPP